MKLYHLTTGNPIHDRQADTNLHKIFLPPFLPHTGWVLSILLSFQAMPSTKLKLHKRVIQRAVQLLQKRNAFHFFLWRKDNHKFEIITKIIYAPGPWPVGWQKTPLPLPMACLFLAQQVAVEADSTSKILLLCDFGMLRHAGTKPPDRFIWESL